MASFTKEQWLTIITFVVVNFCNAMCVSMQVITSINRLEEEEKETRKFIPFGFAKKMIRLETLNLFPFSGPLLSTRGREKGVYTLGIWPGIWCI